MIKKHEQINIRGGYSNSTFLARLFVVLFLCVTLLCGALFTVFFTEKNVVKAIDDATTLKIDGDIYIGDSASKDFNGDVLDEIYNHLVGKDNTTFAEVATLAASRNLPYSTRKIAGGTYIRSLPYNKTSGGKQGDLQVTFGGKKWTIVALSTADNANY